MFLPRIVSWRTWLCLFVFPRTAQQMRVCFGSTSSLLVESHQPFLGLHEPQPSPTAVWCRAPGHALEVAKHMELL